MFRLRCLVPCVAWCAGMAGLYAGPSASDAMARRIIREQPLHFEANSGQWNRTVKFRASDSSVFLTSRGAVLAVGGKTVSLRLERSNPRPGIEGAGLLPV